MNTKTTSAVVGAVVAMSLVVNAVSAQQAEAGKPRQKFKGPPKVFILAGQSNMQGHAKVSTFEYLTQLQKHASELSSEPDSWMPWNYRDMLQRTDAP